MELDKALEMVKSPWLNLDGRSVSVDTVALQVIREAARAELARREGEGKKRMSMVELIQFRDANFATGVCQKGGTNCPGFAPWGMMCEHNQAAQWQVTDLLKKLAEFKEAFENDFGAGHSENFLVRKTQKFLRSLP